MKLSSIIIAKDEEHNIARCIESQLNCIDEIVVLIDSSTTDNTIEIVKSYNVKFEVKDWLGFSESKKYALSLCENEWVFWIDADEEITAELQNELNQFKIEENNNYSAYKVARRAFFLGKWIKHCGWYPGYVTRLFNKNKANFSDSDVHEHLIVDGKTSRLKNDLNHFTDPDINHYFKKFNTYTSLAADELFAKKRRAGINDIILRPMFLFFKMYFIRRGFLDGMHGFILSIFSAAYVGVKYTKLWELNKKVK